MNRLALTPLRRLCAAARPARRHRRAGPDPGADLPDRRARDRRRGHRGGRRRRARDRRALAAGLARRSAASARSSPCGPGAARRCRGCSRCSSRALFLSSMALPRDLIEKDWFRTVADWNPVSYMLEGIRSLVIVGLGPRGAGARLRLRRRHRAGRARWRPRRRCARGWCGHEPGASGPWRAPWPGAAPTTSSPTRRSCVPGAAVPDVLLHRLRGRAVAGGLGARASTSPAATRRSCTGSCCCRRPPSAACSRASRSRATSSRASPAG